MTRPFDAFVAMDWSGARTAGGIAVAECPAGQGAPALVLPPDGRRWSRAAALDWIDRRLGTGDRVLVGIDCAFSLPFERAERYFPAGGGTAFALWDLVERASAGEPDYFGGAFAGHPAHAADYWTSGPRPAGWAEPHRATELACRAEGWGAPDSPYKLIGAKQVGKGALAGMRVLRELKARHGGAVAVWPFEDPGAARSAVVEIYPRLFLIRCGFGLRKLRRWKDLNAALARLGSDGVPEPDAPASDHDTDALVSAAGLRWLARRPGAWTPRGLDERARRQEGWIFGVGA